MSQPIAGLEACSSQCNPASPGDSSGFGPCAPGLACYVDGTVAGATDCGPAGMGGVGASCNKIDDCGPSLTCLHNTTTNTNSCVPSCLMGSGSTCPSGSCQSFATMEFVAKGSAMIEVGFCG
jgi:hypothetical protein